MSCLPLVSNRCHGRWHTWQHQMRKGIHCLKDSSRGRLTKPRRTKRFCHWQRSSQQARPDSLLVASPFVWPLAKIMPVRLSRLGVGEAADVTRTPELWCCCRVAAISDCQAINLQEIKQMKFLCRLWGTVKYFFYFGLVINRNAVNPSIFKSN